MTAGSSHPDAQQVVREAAARRAHDPLGFSIADIIRDLVVTVQCPSCVTDLARQWGEGCLPHAIAALLNNLGYSLIDQEPEDKYDPTQWQNN